MSVDEEERREALEALRRFGFAESDFDFREIAVKGRWMKVTEVWRQSTGARRRYVSVLWVLEFESDLQAGLFGSP